MLAASLGVKCRSPATASLSDSEFSIKSESFLQIYIFAMHLIDEIEAKSTMNFWIILLQ